MRVTRPAFWGLFFSLLLLVLSCESVKVEGPTGPGQNQVTVASVSVSPSTFSIAAGATSQLSATVRGSDGSTLTTKTVTWSSSGATVATVNSSGLVMGVGPGTVTITATADGVSGSAAGTVGNPTPVIVSFSPASANYGQDAFQLTVTGSGFTSASVVRMDNVDKTTQYVSPTQIKASIAASDLKPSGQRQITVFNPSPGGGASTAVPFEVTLCTRGTLASGGSESATLAGGDCRFDDGTYFHTWTFEATAGQLYQATLESGAFDTFVIVSDPTAETIVGDNNSGESTNSRYTLKAGSSGTYRIWVNTLSAGQFGSYVVRLRSPTELALDTPFGGQIPVSGQGSGGEGDAGGPSRVEGVPADRFGFPVTENAGILVEARPTTGSALDPAIEVFELGDEVLGGDYDALTTGGEILAGVAGAARYGSFDIFGGGGSIGAYEVSVQQCRIFTLVLGGSATGATSLTNDCALGGAGVSGGGFPGVFLTFSGNANQRIDLLATSSWDNFLILFGPDGAFLDSDDDSGGGTNAKISATLPSDGDYIAYLMPWFSSTVGSFTASLTFGSGAPSQPTSIQEKVVLPGQGMSIQTYLSEFGFRSTQSSPSRSVGTPTTNEGTVKDRLEALRLLIRGW